MTNSEKIQQAVKHLNDAISCIDGVGDSEELTTFNILAKVSEIKIAETIAALEVMDANIQAKKG